MARDGVHPASAKPLSGLENSPYPAKRVSGLRENSFSSRYTLHDAQNKAVQGFAAAHIGQAQGGLHILASRMHTQRSWSRCVPASSGLCPDMSASVFVSVLLERCPVALKLRYILHV
ncbi:hypothetical protein AD948_00415 [Acetobacter senegalensis]|uniref:Uncharacterized protein n=1 Tax=Acetobacter senegalensis TaxID=446692 RepID=A0A149U8P1_9PROT|nr:hypothetical protein AD948_00415 [Acetobacter senegalensis]